jgi:hypothetical protein
LYFLKILLVGLNFATGGGEIEFDPKYLVVEILVTAEEIIKPLTLVFIQLDFLVVLAGQEGESGLLVQGRCWDRFYYLGKEVGFGDV